VDPRSWYWRTTGHGLELWLDPEIPRSPEDRDGRLLSYSCGATVHHARIALAAQGLATLTYPYPDADYPDWVALVAVYGTVEAHPTALRLCDAIDHGRPHCVPGQGKVLDDTTFLALKRAVQGERCFLSRLDDERVHTLDAALRASGVLPRVWHADSTVELAGRMLLGSEEPGSASLALLSNPCEGHQAWLTAGQAWSVACLTGTDLGLTVTALPATLGPDAATAIRRELPRLGYPNVVLRFGRFGRG
jgi:hypothetical protein